MDKWYDEFAVNCEGCGWLRQGSYLDGLPYLTCMLTGTILHKQSGVECKDWRSPFWVKKKMEQWAREEQKRKRKRALTTVETTNNEEYDTNNED